MKFKWSLSDILKRFKKEKEKKKKQGKEPRASPLRVLPLCSPEQLLQVLTLCTSKSPLQLCPLFQLLQLCKGNTMLVLQQAGAFGLSPRCFPIELQKLRAQNISTERRTAPISSEGLVLTMDSHLLNKKKKKNYFSRQQSCTTSRTTEPNFYSNLSL